MLDVFIYTGGAFVTQRGGGGNATFGCLAPPRPAPLGCPQVYGLGVGGFVTGDGVGNAFYFPALVSK